jgi:nucleotide-binding universal stress UspA family protein
MGTNILIGSDLGDSSKLAIQTGLVWAKILKCNPIIIYVEDKKEEKKEIIDGLTERLHEQIRLIANDEKLIKSSYVVFGKKEERLLQEIESNNAKLLVLGTTGDSGIKDFLTSGTTEMAIRNIPIPILAIKGEGAKSPTNIFWAIDLSNADDFCFEWVKIISLYFNVNVLIGFIADAKYFDHKSSTNDLDSLLDGTAREKIQSYQEGLEKEGINTEVKIHPEGHTGIAMSLEAMIEGSSCDLVVMGTAAKKGLKRLIMGSVSESLIHKIKDSIFIVKSPN